MNNLERLKELLDNFCKKEYNYGPSKFNKDRLDLFPVDNGGYDVAEGIIFEINVDSFILRVKNEDGDYERFELKLI